MKKAKLFVGALGLIFILSAVLAFKVNTYSNHVLYTGAVVQPGGGTECTIRTEGIILGTGPGFIRASTTPLLVDCPIVFIQDVDDE